MARPKSHLIKPAYTLLFLWMACPLFLLAQQDSIQQIIVEKPQKAPSNFSEEGGGRDLIRKRFVHRLDLDAPKNSCLVLGTDSQGKQTNLVEILLEEMKKGRLKGIDAGSFKQGFSYFHLVRDLFILEGLQEAYQQDTIDMSLIDWEWMSKYVDLIVEEGFAADNSLSFRRIKYLRLNWFHPDHPRGLYGVVFFPYAEVEQLFEQIQCPHPNGWNASQFLKFIEYQSTGFPLSKDPEKTPTLRSKS